MYNKKWIKWTILLLPVYIHQNMEPICGHSFFKKKVMCCTAICSSSDTKSHFVYYINIF